MFKRRTNNKKIDLNQELDQIHTPQQPPSPTPTPPSPQHPLSPQQEKSQPPPPKLHEQSFASKYVPSKPRAKANFITLQAMERTEAAENQPVKKEVVQEVGREEMHDYLSQIRNLKPLEHTQGENEDSQGRAEGGLMVGEGKNGYNSEEYEDNEMLEVEQDLQGGLSPQREQEQYHEDYEDQLIKRTLTRHNYEQLRLRGGPVLSDLKAIETRDKLLEKIDRVSEKRIVNTIKRDLEEKRKKLAQLEQEARMKKYGLEREGKEIHRKEKRLGELREELVRLNCVIEQIYYYGDTVTVFDREAVLRLAQQEKGKSHSLQFEDVE